MKLIEGFDSNYRYILVAAHAVPGNRNPEHRRWSKPIPANRAALRKTRVARAR